MNVAALIPECPVSIPRHGRRLRRDNSAARMDQSPIPRGSAPENIAISLASDSLQPNERSRHGLQRTLQEGRPGGCVGHSPPRRAQAGPAHQRHPRARRQRPARPRGAPRPGHADAARPPQGTIFARGPQGARFRLHRSRLRAVPLQRLLRRRPAGRDDAVDPRRHPHDRATSPAHGRDGHRPLAARPDARHRDDGQRQEHDAGGDDRPHQQQL
jgi:hypothetical protein